MLRTLVKMAIAASVAVFVSSAAQAGGFHIRGYSTTGLGAAFAGLAAGNYLSSVFANSAGISIVEGLEAEADGTLIVTDSNISGTATFEPAPPLDLLYGSSVPLSFLSSNGGDFVSPAFVPAMYAGTPLNDRLKVGFGFTGHFGLVTKPDNDNWAGQFEARTSELRTYNFNPVASYQLTPTLIVGAGAQVQYADATLKSAFPNLGAFQALAVFPPLALPDQVLIDAFGRSNPNLVIDGDGFGFGYTLGLLWNPLSGTDLGIGFRSSIEQTLEGNIGVAGVSSLGQARTSTDLETPAIATASARQRVSDRLTLLGTVQWTNWSDLDEVVVKARSSNANLGAVAGRPVAVIPLDWHDGWFFSGGLEYEISERTIIRSGVAYEESPIQNAVERSARLPDTNRVWLSIGATRNISTSTTLNLAYSHVFFEDGSIDRRTVFPVGDIRFVGRSEQDVDVFALSLNIKLGNRERSLK
jgi:long-chain fatty acid transport protein